MISFIIPSYNNLKHLKNVYASIKKHAYDNYVCSINRKQDFYEKNNEIMFNHFKNKFGF